MLNERPYEIWSNESVENLIQVIIESIPECLNDENVLDYKYLALMFEGHRSEMAIRIAVKVNWIYINKKLQDVGLKVNRVHATFPITKLPILAEAINKEYYRDPAGRIQWRLISEDIFPDFDPKVLRKAFRYYIKGKLEG